MREKHNNHHTHTRAQRDTHTESLWKGQLGDRRAIISKLMAVTMVCCMPLLHCFTSKSILTMY